MLRLLLLLLLLRRRRRRRCRLSLLLLLLLLMMMPCSRLQLLRSTLWHVSLLLLMSRLPLHAPLHPCFHLCPSSLLLLMSRLWLLHLLCSLLAAPACRMACCWMTPSWGAASFWRLQ